VLPADTVTGNPKLPLLNAIVFANSFFYLFIN